MSDIESDEIQKPLALWWTNVVLPFAVTVLFILLVMIAIAQQEVISTIKQKQLPYGYGAALAINRVAQSKQAELAELQREQGALLKQSRAEQAALGQASRQMEDAWQDLAPLLARARRVIPCEISIPSDANFGARVAALYEFRHCDDSSAVPATARTIAATKEKADAFEQSAREYRKGAGAIATTRERLNALNEEKELKKLSEQEELVSGSFSDMDVLLGSWTGFGNFLVRMPPAMLQILLTFFSGLFGAVLITLVLVVYPKNVVEVHPTTRTGSRVFLGGLIALCVYIVILGGTAVLGSASTISAAGTNYMAFAGIGILAGMFSDRVAGWLSERADAFFKRQQLQRQARQKRERGRK